MIDPFFKELRLAAKEYGAHLTKKGKIRLGHKTCPITAVCLLKTGRRYLIQEYYEAAEAAGYYSYAFEIASAADHKFRSPMRDELLKACGLEDQP